VALRIQVHAQQGKEESPARNESYQDDKSCDKDGFRMKDVMNVTYKAGNEEEVKKRNVYSVNRQGKW